MKKHKSTFEKWMEDEEIRKAHEEEKPYFLISELIHELMNEKGISIRELAKETGLSANTIQKIRKGEATNVRFHNVYSLLKTFGFRLIAEKDERRIVFMDK